MDEPKLTVRDLTPPRPVVVCDSGRHFAHPGETCAELDELAAAFEAYLERSLRQAYAEAGAEAQRVFDQRYITGNGTGEPRGFLTAKRISIPYPLSDAEVADHGFIVGEPEPEPTPAERALAILDPHLRACPLYNAGPPTIYSARTSALPLGGMLPPGVGATADRAPAWLGRACRMW